MKNHFKKYKIVYQCIGVFLGCIVFVIASCYSISAIKHIYMLKTHENEVVTVPTDIITPAPDVATMFPDETKTNEHAYKSVNDPALKDVNEDDAPNLTDMTKEEFDQLSIYQIKALTKKYIVSFRKTYQLDNSHQMTEDDWKTIKQLMRYQLFHTLQ